MEIYIIRIYRRGSTPIKIEGLVERAGTNRKESFHDIDELVRMLTLGDRGPPDVGDQPDIE